MDRPPPTESPETPSRTRTLLASNAFRAAIVVLSAAIIFGAWAFAEYGGDETPDENPEIVLTLDDEYERARLAAESGDTDEAIEILERILAEDPDHEQAAALLRQLRNDETATSPDSTNGQPATDPSQTGDTPAQPGEEPDDPAPRDDSAYLAPVSNMDSLLPQVISGWQRGSPVVDDTSATVPFSPDTPGEISRVALLGARSRFGRGSSRVPGEHEQGRLQPGRCVGGRRRQRATSAPTGADWHGRLCPRPVRIRGRGHGAGGRSGSVKDEQSHLPASSRRPVGRRTGVSSCRSSSQLLSAELGPEPGLAVPESPVALALVVPGGLVAPESAAIALGLTRG
jgi:hypothetical protein